MLQQFAYLQLVEATAGICTGCVICHCADVTLTGWGHEIGPHSAGQKCIPSLHFHHPVAQVCRLPPLKLSSRFVEDVPTL